MTDAFDTVARHYTMGDMGARILAALTAEGVDVDRLTTANLTNIDQFHTRGMLATKEQGEAASPAEGMHVLDVGCGVGGPARYLAETYRCRVTGVDLTAEYVEVATMLSARTGMDRVTEFRQANALDLPFADGTFDMAWCQNVSMNVEDMDRFYGEVFRVLKPGGKFVSADVSAGDGRTPEFPLPWAREPAISFVSSQDEIRSALEGAGFRILDWKDTTADAVAAQNKPSQQARRSPLGVALVAGADFPLRSGNLAKCLADGRFTSVQFVAQKPA
jgi:SAM-dependent methyltransferase